MILNLQRHRIFSPFLELVLSVEKTLISIKLSDNEEHYFLELQQTFIEDGLGKQNNERTVLQPKENYSRKIHKIKQNRFFFGKIVLRFLEQLSKYFIFLDIHLMLKFKGFWRFSQNFIS